MDDNQPNRLRPKGLITRDKYVRLLIQAVDSMGYGKVAEELKAESGIQYDPTEFSSLKSQILNANWDESADAICKIRDVDEETRRFAMYLVFRQWVFECLSRDDKDSLGEALQKNHYVYQMGNNYTKKVADYITNFSEIDISGLNDGIIGEMREGLVADLAIVLPTAVPEKGLLGMLEYAARSQRYSCSYHNTADSISLLEDHFCTRDQFPTEAVQILNNHSDEVWFVKFSNNGKYLASSSRDCTTIIWKVTEDGNVEYKRSLKGHNAPVCFVSWNPNDQWLVTCGYEEVLKVWHVETENFMWTLPSTSGTILSSCAWSGDGNKVIFGTSKSERCMYVYDILARQVATKLDVTNNPMIADFNVTPNGEHLIYILAEKRIVVRNVVKDESRFIDEESAIVSVSVSEDSEYLMVHLIDQEIHVWDVKGLMRGPLWFTGHKQARFVLYSCFGGFEEMFIASGSEDSQVYIWNQTKPKPLEVLAGHSMTVNCVSWNPKRFDMLASASDDGTVRIWRPRCWQTNNNKKKKKRTRDEASTSTSANVPR